MSAHPTHPDDDPRTPDDRQVRGRDDDSAGGPPYRAIAMVLLTAVVVAVAIGLVQLFGSDSDEDPTQTAAHPSSSSQSAPQPSAGQAPAQSPAPGAAPAGDDQQQSGQSPSGQAPAEPSGQGADGQPAVPVRILNNSNVTGLAGRTGDQLRGAGFDVKDVTNFPSSQGVLPQSQVYFGTAPGEEQTAQAVAQKLGIQAQPRPQGFEPTMPGVIVVVTQDLQR